MYYFLCNVQAETLYVFLAWNSHQKCDFLHCIFRQIILQSPRTVTETTPRYLPKIAEVMSRYSAIPRVFGHSYYSRPPLLTWVTSSQAWISIYMNKKIWVKIISSFPSPNGATFDVCEWIGNFIPHLAVYMLGSKLIDVSKICTCFRSVWYILLLFLHDTYLKIYWSLHKEVLTIVTGPCVCQKMIVRLRSCPLWHGSLWHGTYILK